MSTAATAELVVGDAQEQRSNLAQVTPDNCVVYVGDVDAGVSERELREVFEHVAPVVLLTLCKHHVTGLSLGYAYVTFNTAEDGIMISKLAT